MIDPSAKFVCNISDDAQIKIAVEILNDSRKAADEKLEFLKRQAEATRNELKACWKNIWETCVRAGKIDPKLNYDEWHLFLADDGKQLIIEKCDGGHHGPFIMLGGE